MTRFELEARPDGQTQAHVRYADSERWAALVGGERWGYLAQHVLGDPSREATLTEIEALVALGSDLVVTSEPALLAVRDQHLARGLNLMSPEEAFVIAGVWSRVTHAAFIGGSWGTNVGSYYRALAHALAPAAPPALSRLANLERTECGGRTLFDLVDSILRRLASSCRALDRLVATWQCVTDNDSLSELLDELDRVVLNSWAIYDNLALLLTERFAIPVRSAADVSLVSAKWRRKLRASGGAALDEIVEAHRPHLMASHEVRHQLVHRAALLPITEASSGGKGGTPLVWFEGNDLLGNLAASAQELGQNVADWGVRQVFEPGPEDVVILGNDGAEHGSYTIERERRALVDPLTYGLRVAADAATLSRLLLASFLPFIDDSPTPGQSGATAAGYDWFLPGAGRVAILSSPLSGLVELPG